MTKESIIRCAEAGRPFFGQFWETSIIKIVNYEIVDDESGWALVYCSGHGSYDWYRLEDYGIKWAFHLCELSEGVVDVTAGNDIKEIPKTKELGILKYKLKAMTGDFDYEKGYRDGLRFAIATLEGKAPYYELKRNFGLSEYRQTLLKAIYDNELDDYIADNPLITAEDLERFISDIARAEKGVEE